MTVAQQDTAATSHIDGLAAQARALTDDRAYEEAAALWRQAIAAAGSAAAQAAAWDGLGGALRELARWEAAADAFRQAAALQPTLVPAWTGLALALVGLGDADSGLAAARTALDLNPAAVDAHRAAALACLRAGQPDAAEDSCAAALSHVPDHPETLATLALLRMMQDRLDEADALFRKAIGAKPTMAEAIGNHASLLARRGDNAEAQRRVALAIKLKPFLPAPFFLLGNLLRANGQQAEAIEAYHQALRLMPAHPDAWVAMADTLMESGRLSDVAATCRAGLERRPRDVRLLVLLGNARQGLGETDAACDAYIQALAVDPDMAAANNNLARLYQATGRRGLAIAVLTRAAQARPHDTGLSRNLSAVLLDAGRDAEAEAAARATLANGPADPANHRQLAHVLMRQGRLADAVAVLESAVETAPDDGESWFQAAGAFLKAGLRPRAVACCQQAIRLRPDENRNWALLAQALRGLSLQAPDPELRDLLVRALRRPGVEAAHLTEAATSAILLEPAPAAIAAAIAAAAANGHDPASALAPLLNRADILRALADDALLMTVLETVIVTDPVFERLLTVLRHALLNAAGQEGISVLDHPFWTPLLTAIARQCFLNEYVFAETPAETAALIPLEQGIRIIMERQEAPIANRLALCAAYRPLGRLAGVEALLGHANWPPAIQTLLRLQVGEPRIEAALAAELPQLTAVDSDPVSRDVRAQYEASPYPRWADAGLLDKPLPFPQMLRILLPHVDLAPEPRWNAPEILVAGCGAGRESVWTANQIAGARILAVDLSRTSLAYASRQTRRLGITTIDYAQADLLQLEPLGRRFDIIQSVGVLHHMADPLAGWRALTGLLRPGGIMKIGLYSARARTAVVAARSFIAERGYPATPDGIRRFRQDALALPAGHPVRAIAGSPDFYNVSACRDLAFHVQEHRLTIPQIAAWTGELGLEFLGFQLDDPGLATRYRQRFPHDPAMTDLAAWDRFEEENPTTFSNLYQFWLRRPLCAS